MLPNSEAVDMPLRPMANEFSGCFVWALALFCVVFVVCRLLRSFRWRNASSAPDFAGRCAWLVAVIFCVLSQSIGRPRGLYMSV